MYLKFTTKLECQNAIKEIDKRMGLNSNLTVTFAIPMLDINGNYVIPKPKHESLDSLHGYEIVESVELPTVESEV